MGWSGITSVTTYSAGNAQAVSVQSGEMVKIRTVRPVTGPDGEVVIYDQTGTPIKTISVSKTNPDNTVEFLTSATSLNYSTTVAFDSPGLTIDFAGASPLPSYNPSTGATQFTGAVSASGDGGIQGGFIGTWDDEASLPVSATPGAFATTRDGKSFVWGA